MFKDKIVLVTGSSRGIGKAIAQAFGENNAVVILNSGKDEQALIETYKEFKNKNIKCDYFFADISDYGQTENMIKNIYLKYQKIDILVNNAGISYVGLLTDMNYDEWKNLMGVNVDSLFNCCKNIVPNMVSSKKGIIINISSMWGVCGASCEVAYSASKGAVNSFTKALARELGPSGIRVNAVACGVIDTKMNNWLNSEEKFELTEEISLMRFGKVSEVADMVLFLASEKSSFLTGQVITLDGGMI